MASDEDSWPGPLFALTEAWIKLWQQAASLPDGDLAAAALLDARQLQNLWLTGLSATADRYMRSPAFLELIGQTSRAMAASANLSSPFRVR
jgi:hypothetical protein